jgi:DNA-binding NtrC family response regulator
MPDGIIGTSSVIARFRKNLQYLSKDTAPLILTGEGGVGKSFLASQIHFAGPHGGANMESLNFSIVSERDQRIGLLGAEPPELSTSRRSLLERKTTVVLKHIDHANRFIQDKLAESLATSMVTRLGSSQRHPLSARVIITFRRTLQLLDKQERLTPNLHQILHQFKRINILPLRKRREDIPLLARNYAMKLYREYCEPVATIRGIERDGTIDVELVELLLNHRWNENVRDLLAYIHSLVTLPFRGEVIEQERLELSKMARMVEAGEEFSLPSGLASVRRRLVDRALQKSHRHKTKVAQLLGISERALGRIRASRR